MTAQLRDRIAHKMCNLIIELFATREYRDACCAITYLGTEEFRKKLEQERA